MTPGVSDFPGDDAEDVKAVQAEHFRAAVRAMVNAACDAYTNALALVGLRTELGDRIEAGLRYQAHLFWGPVRWIATAFRRDVWQGAQGDLFIDTAIRPPRPRQQIIEGAWWDFFHDTMQRIIKHDVTLTRLVIRVAAEQNETEAAKLANLLADDVAFRFRSGG